MTQLVTLNMTSATPFKTLIRILAFSPTAAIPRPKRTEKRITGIISPSAIDLKMFVGMIDRTSGQKPLLCSAVLAVAMYLEMSVPCRSWMLINVPGWVTLAMVIPRIKAIVVRTSK